MLHYIIRQSWLEIYDVPSNLESYRAYYSALSQCVIKNQRLLRDELERSDWLKILLNTDSTQLVIHNPETQLDKEFTKVKWLISDKIDKKGFIYYIIDILSDIAMPNSGLECPTDRCSMGDGGMLRYVLAVNNDEQKEVVLTCDTCGYSMHRNGTPLTAECRFYPVTKGDMKEY